MCLIIKEYVSGLLGFCIFKEGIYYYYWRELCYFRLDLGNVLAQLTGRWQHVPRLSALCNPPSGRLHGKDPIRRIGIKEENPSLAWREISSSVVVIYSLGVITGTPRFI